METTMFRLTLTAWPTEAAKPSGCSTQTMRRDQHTFDAKNCGLYIVGVGVGP